MTKKCKKSWHSSVPKGWGVPTEILRPLIPCAGEALTETHTAQWDLEHLEMWLNAFVEDKFGKHT